MKKISLVVLSAGNSNRFKATFKKQWLRVGDIPLWLHATNNFKTYHNFAQIIVVGSLNEIKYMEKFNDGSLTLIAGGNSRQKSIKNALSVNTSKYIMITDVARCCVPKYIFKKIIKNKKKADCIVPYVNINDSAVYNDKTITRENIKLIQTPQLSKAKTLIKALQNSVNFTDDRGAIENINGTIHFVKGSKKSSKLTFKNDISNIKCLKKPSKDIFTGTGLDIHQFEDNKKMVLGGVHIKSSFGFKAHSDGDVLIHSVIDALLGAIGADDIGEFFPDSNFKYKNADSRNLLKNISQFVSNVGFEIINIDTTIIAQKPKLSSYRQLIIQEISSILSLPKYKINIKATTGEYMGFIGRSEGICVQSIANVKYTRWERT